MSEEKVAPDWYAEWRHEALHQLIDKQERLESDYGAGNWPRYDYDVNTGLLTFSEDGIIKVIADIQVVGTISSQNWFWGWANDHWPGMAVADMEEVVSFGETHGIQELISGYVADSDLNQLGWDLTAVAVRILNAAGAYRSPSKTGALFLLIKSIRLVN